MKQNVNSDKLISEKDKVRIVNTLFKVKLQVVTIQLAALLKRSFPNANFSQNFQSNFSFDLFCIKGPERLHSNASLWKTRKTCKDQKKTEYTPGSTEWVVLTKNSKDPAKMPMSELCFNSVTLWL